MAGETITTEELVQLKRLCRLTRATDGDTDQMLALYKKYVNPSPAYCTTCPNGIRMLFERMKKYYNEVK